MTRFSLGEGLEFDLDVKDGAGNPDISQSGGEICIDVSSFAGKIYIRKPAPVVEEESEEEGSDGEEDVDTAEEAKKGHKFEDIYKEGKFLGEGAFSKVHVAIHKKTKKEYAVKTVDRSKANWNGRDVLTDELENMRALRDAPFIARFQDVFNEGSFSHVILEYIPGGELFDRVIEQGTFSEKEARDACKCILKALEYMHGKRIAHRDVKPENLLLVNPKKLKSIRLSDFGFSKKLEKKNACRTLCGTPGYLAPEVLERWPAYDVPCDIWGFGCTLFLLLGGYAAFDPNSSNDVNGIFERTRNAEFHFYPERWSNISKWAKDLVARCLNINPSKRITAKTALRHEWMKAKVTGNKVNAKTLQRAKKGKENKKTRREDLKKDFHGFINQHEKSLVTNRTSMSKVNTAAVSKDEGCSGKPISTFYKRGDKLGEGAFAVVYRCRHNATRMDYAVKEISIDGLGDRELKTLQGEINVLKFVRGGPSIIRLFDVFHEPHMVHLVMEEMKGGDLLGRIAEKEVYTEFEARNTCIHLFEAVKYCHRKRIAHRDIKLENLLLVEKGDESTIKLADFGFAKKYKKQGGGLTTLCGTPNYMAPEVITLPEEGSYDHRCDVWSVGVTVYCLLGGYLPFEGPDFKTICRKIVKGKFKFHDQYWENVSTPAKEMITEMLQKDTDKRLTVEQAMSCDWMGLAEDKLTVNDLSSTQKMMATMKFKKATKKLMNINKFGALAAAGKADKPTAPTETPTEKKTIKFRDIGNQVLKLDTSMNALAKLTALQDAEDEDEDNFDENYELLEQIGEGEFAKLYVGTSKKTKEEVTVKTVCRNNLMEPDVAALDDEISVLQAVKDSKHVIRLKETFEDPDHTHIVMERLHGIALIEQVVKRKQYTEFDAKELVRNLLLGIHHCHSRRIAIRNLKLESLILPDDDPTNVKITDFECATFVTFPNSLHTQCGTQEYVAPEVLENHPAYDVSCDIWTVGVIVFIMVGGTYPFRAKTEVDVMRKIRYGEFKFHSKYWKKISSDAKNLVKQMMKVSPEERITASDALSHAWIHKEDKDLAKYDLTQNLNELAGDLAKRKLKGAVKTILAMQKLNGIGIQALMSNGNDSDNDSEDNTSSCSK